MKINIDKLHKYAFKRPTGRGMGKSTYSYTQTASLLLCESSKTIFNVMHCQSDFRRTLEGVLKILKDYNVEPEVNYQNRIIRYNGKTVYFIIKEDYPIKTLGFHDFNYIEDLR